jgi:hypothetical protein
MVDRREDLDQRRLSWIPPFAGFPNAKGNSGRNIPPGVQTMLFARLCEPSESVWRERALIARRNPLLGAGRRPAVGKERRWSGDGRLSSAKAVGHSVFRQGQ